LSAGESQPLAKASETRKKSAGSKSQKNLKNQQQAAHVFSQQQNTSRYN